MTGLRPRTLGELKATGYRTRKIKDEIRSNLVRKLRTRERLFPGIKGYDKTVVPQVVNALLARHDFILLGLRGQAKSRILRQLVDFLDEEIPFLAGSEVNDDPLRPVSKHGRTLVLERGDDAPIEWLQRDHRYVEKLATPDVTIADVIGDVDPIKAARGGHILARRAHDPLRAAPARQPRNLCAERAAGPSGQDPGGALQHPARGRCAGEGVSHPPRA